MFLGVIHLVNQDSCFVPLSFSILYFCFPIPVPPTSPPLSPSLFLHYTFVFPSPSHQPFPLSPPLFFYTILLFSHPRPANLSPLLPLSFSSLYFYFTIPLP